MFRPTVAARAAAPLRATARPVARRVVAPRFRTFATESAPPPNNSGGAPQGVHTALILAAIAALGGGIYYAVKPVADVAMTAKSAISTAQGGASELGDTASQLAKAFLPPGAFTLFSAVAANSGGIGGFLSNLKDKDLQGVLDEVKKVGGDDVKRITEKVEKRLKEANGKVQNLDWKSLAEELKQELPKDKQHMVDMLIGKIPDKADFENLISKAKEAGAEQFKAAEKAAGKVLEQVEKAKKDGKSQADAFLTGLKSAAPGDVDELVNQLKEAAKKAGLPADTIESWVKSKAGEGKIDAEQMASQLQDKLKTAAKFLPGEPSDLVKQVEQVSPSVAKLLQQAMEQAEIIKKK